MKTEDCLPGTRVLINNQEVWDRVRERYHIRLNTGKILYPVYDGLVKVLFEDTRVIVLSDWLSLFVWEQEDI